MLYLFDATYDNHYFYFYGFISILSLLQSVECALQTLKSSSADMFYRKHAWNLIKCFLVSAVNLDDDKVTLTHLLLHHTFQDGPVQSLSNHNIYECSDPHIRGVMKKALTAMFGMDYGVQ